jgi:hypothetical protein
MYDEMSRILHSSLECSVNTLFPPFTILTQQNPFPVSVHGEIMPVSMSMRRINMFCGDFVANGVGKIVYLL